MLTARLKAWWLSRLDNDSVRAWVPPYCLVWLTWAVLGLTIFPPISTLYDSMGGTAYHFWVAIAIPANIAPIIGLWMREGDSAIVDMNTRLLFKDWMGLIFQATGHAVCCVLMVLFEMSAWHGAITYDGPQLYAGMTIFAACMLLPWTFGTALLCAQCLRKIQRGQHLEDAAI